jgi:hypothetical protein
VGLETHQEAHPVHRPQPGLAPEQRASRGRCCRLEGIRLLRVHQGCGCQVSVGFWRWHSDRETQAELPGPNRPLGEKSCLSEPSAESFQALMGVGYMTSHSRPLATHSPTSVSTACLQYNTGHGTERKATTRRFRSSTPRLPDSRRQRTLPSASHRSRTSR